MRHSRNSYNNNDAEEGMSGIKKNNKSILICVIVSIVSLLFFINKYIIHKNNHNNILLYLLHNSMYFSFLSSHVKNDFTKYLILKYSTIEHKKIVIILIMYALLINYYLTSN